MFFKPTVSEVLKNFTRLTQNLENAVKNHQEKVFLHQEIIDATTALQKAERSAVDRGTTVLNNLKKLLGE